LYLYLPLLVIWLLGAFGLSYLARGAGPFTWDLEVTRFLQGFDLQVAVAFAGALSFLGGPAMSVGIVLACFIGLWVARHRAESLFVAGTLVPDILNQGLKSLIDRPRPAAELVRVWGEAEGGSFPSGHAFHAILFLGLAIFLIRSNISGGVPRALLMGALGIMVPLMGISRIYLGVHWPSDVLGGYLIGGLFLFIMILSYRVLARTDG